MSTPNLINTLKSQHQAVIGLVGQINDAVVRKDQPAIQKHLDVLGKALLGHLAIEDTELYPALIKAAETSGQDNLATTARLFATNMTFITRALKHFLGRYGTGAKFEMKTFPDDWKNIVSSLDARIRAEETTLYAMYEKVTAAKAGPRVAAAGPTAEKR